MSPRWSSSLVKVCPLSLPLPIHSPSCSPPSLLVAQMSSKYLWTDIRLISFDLQTVEFAYADNYTVSLTCTDQLATNRSSYHLRFSRVPNDDPMQVDGELDALHNPHEDAELYLCNLLGHGKLSTALHRLVSLLRETLPIVAELEDIRVQAARNSHLVDTFAKSAGWFRVLYADLRHALDFRLMTGARVVIVDGSHTLFDEGVGDSRGAAARRPGASSRTTSLANTGALQAIPDFRALVAEAIKDAVAQGVKGQFAPIDIGVICDIAAVRVVGRRLYERVFAKLAQTQAHMQQRPHS